ncbi:unnamed protein product, partial [Amoebophrya sp. A25]|eukprot:GSA25T00006648001.1
MQSGRIIIIEQGPDYDCLDALRERSRGLSSGEIRKLLSMFGPVFDQVPETMTKDQCRTFLKKCTSQGQYFLPPAADEASDLVQYLQRGKAVAQLSAVDWIAPKASDPSAKRQRTDNEAGNNVDDGAQQGDAAAAIEGPNQVGKDQQQRRDLGRRGARIV